MSRAASSRPVETDIRAREYRELAERAVLERDGSMALEACAGWVELHRCGYVLFPLHDHDQGEQVASKPRRMRARYDGRCAACGGPIQVDDPVWWTPERKGVACDRCGGRA